jgi:prephenate dehydrogenase
MPVFQRAVIVGVGLLGGSIGMALRRRGLANQVVGTGRRIQSLLEASSLGAITEHTCDLSAACAKADLVVICTPVQSITDYVKQVAACSLANNALITDVGSTKGRICADLPDSVHKYFCGSHPMAGSENSGVRFASDHLFEDRLTIVTPTRTTPKILTERTEQLWQSLGCRTVLMSPQQHDCSIARVSHLPHLIAAALAGQTADDLLALTGPGWRDTTRVAAGNVELWRQIITDNRLPVLESLRDFTNSLQQWISTLENDDQSQLIELLQRGKQQRDQASGAAHHAQPDGTN